MSSSIRIGQPIPKVCARDKVEGRALYVDDLRVEGALHAVTVRSPVAFGILEGLIPSPKFDWTKVVLVTAEDIPGTNTILQIEEDQPALVSVGSRVRHIGEPVALIAAETKSLAREAMAHLIVEVREENPIFTLDASIKAETCLHGKDNVFRAILLEDGENVDSALDACPTVIEGTYRTGSQEQMYIEPQGVIAQWGEGACRIDGSLQCPYYVHRAVRAALALDDDQVIVRALTTGGGFGGKEEYPSMVAVHAALLARKSGKPIRLIYDREEDISFTPKRHPSEIYHRMGLGEDGSLRVMDIDLRLDGGAYVTLSPVVLSRAVLHAVGPYRVPNVRVRGRVLATNHPPFGAFRGFGAPQAVFATERQIQKAASSVGLDPYEFRRRHALKPGDCTATGQTLDESAAGVVVLDHVLEECGRTKGSRTKEAKCHRGHGLAFWMHGAGFTGSGETMLDACAEVAVVEGGRFEVRASATDMGQGSSTTLAQIAAESLGVTTEDVSIAPPSTDAVPDSGPTVASRTCMIVGSLVERASRQLRDRLLEGRDGDDLAKIAARSFEENGEWREQVRYQSPKDVQWDENRYRGAAYPTYGWAACAVDVAVDPDTLEVRVERCVHVVDVGRAIHPTIVRGQIEGGTVQALGWALVESVPFHEGAVVHKRMSTCLIPTANDVSDLHCVLVEVPYAGGPFGAKGVGEIPIDGPAAAVASAVSDALGIEWDELPIRPEDLAERLWRQS